MHPVKTQHHIFAYAALTMTLSAAPVAGDITNFGPWTPETRKQDREAELWRHDQHGVVDHFATPFRFEDLLGEGQPPDKWLDRSQPIDNPYKKSTQAARRCDGSAGIELARPVPLPNEQVRGKRVRIFFSATGTSATKTSTGRIGRIALTPAAISAAAACRAANR